MAITESNRYQLHQALVEALGEQEAATLMEHLPPIGWADVATKTDLEHLRVATTTEFEHVRAEIEHLRTVMDTRFDAADSRLDAKISGVRTEISGLRAEVATQFKDAQRWQLTALVAATAILGVLITFV